MVTVRFNYRFGDYRGPVVALFNTVFRKSKL
jgi:hypothetical protein